MNKCMFLFSIITSLSLSAMDNKPTQIKIPESSVFHENAIDRVRVFVRQYERDDNKSVTLVPMQHAASPEFYRAVEDLMRDQIVIYEQVGGDWDGKQIKEEREALARLGDDYVQAYALLCDKDAQTARFGIVSQDVLSYDGCGKIIRADVGNILKEMSASECEQFTKGRDSTSLKASVDEAYKFAMMNPYFYFKQKNCPDEPCEHRTEHGTVKVWVDPRITARWSQLDTTVSSEEVVAALENSEAINIGLLTKILLITGSKVNAKDEFFFFMGKQMDEAKPGTFWPPEGSNYPKDSVEKIFGRNPCIFRKLDEYLASPETGSIMVVYGAWHMPFVEEYLLAQGFAQAGDPLELTALTKD